MESDSLDEYEFNIFTNNITIYDFKGSNSPDCIYEKMKDDVYGILDIDFSRRRYNIRSWC